MPRCFRYRDGKHRGAIGRFIMLEAFGDDAPQVLFSLVCTRTDLRK